MWPTTESVHPPLLSYLLAYLALRYDPVGLWKSLGKTVRHSRKRARNRLCLESLEARCLPSTVTNLSDHDPGSLRDAIATTPNGGTVDFEPGLTGTIILTTGEL